MHNWPGGVLLRLAAPFDVLAEYKMTFAWEDASIPGGSARATFHIHHALVGLAWVH